LLITKMFKPMEKYLSISKTLDFEDLYIYNTCESDTEDHLQKLY